MHKSIFREYDIRGKVDSELMIDEVYDLTRAIAYYFVKHDKDVKTVAVGMDGRTHSPAIRDQVCKALIDSGLNVVFIGVCPSPVLYFALRTLPVQAGLMITASHNTKEYNGLKICLRTRSVWGKQIQEIYGYFKEGRQVAALEQGEMSEHLVIPEYIAWMVKHFPHLKGMSLSVIVDCANGAAGTVLPQLVKAMQWDNVQLLYPEVDGSYPNHEADPTVEENMQDLKKLLATTDAQVGVGLDGDCDRMAAMTKNGFLVPGDQLLAVFAQSIIKKYPDLVVVCDIKSSSGLIQLVQALGGQVVVSPSGHSWIKETMKKHDALLAGELSCHFFFGDRYFGYDDGIYAMMRLFELLVESGKSLQELLTIFPKKVSSPEYRIPCPEDKKHEIVQAIKDEFSKRADIQLLTIDGVRATMDYGWGIVRPSNTQPVLSMRFESDSDQGLQHVKQNFFAVLKKYFDLAKLKEQLEL